jgi:translocation and assembly module TamA
VRRIDVAVRVAAGSVVGVPAQVPEAATMKPTQRFWTRVRPRSWKITAACLLVTLLALTGCERGRSPADDASVSPTPQPPAAGSPALRYEVAIEGVGDSALRGLLQQVSETVRLIDRPPPSLARLRRRAQDDRARLLEVLRSEGYYDGQIEVAINSDVEPIKVTFQVDLGPLFRLGSVSIEVEPPEPRLTVPSPAEIALEPGAPAAAATVLAAEQNLLNRVRAQGFILGELGTRRAVVDLDTDKMDLTLRVRPGPVSRFGPVTIDGLTTVQQDFVRNRLDWREGELITPARLTDARNSLRETGLFTTVQIDLADAPDADGLVPVTIDLTERKHRSFGLGVRYRTDEGPGGSISWEHRNMFGRGEQVAVEADGSFIGASLIGTFRKPDFGRRNQSLVADLRLAYDDTDAFESRSARTRVGLERQLREGMLVALGVSFLAQEVTDKALNEASQNFGLFSLPARFEWDRSDNRLDPTRGGRLWVENEPFVDVIGNGLLFNKSRVDYTHYLEVVEDPQIVLAGRTALGAMVGASRRDIPANLRFYAGGGGSVRGFGYQLAGQLNDRDDPIGGRSLLELSGEVRVRVTETIGAVGFVDAGTVYSSAVPDFSETLRIGAGPGLRYFSPIGPLRIDVGFPLNPRNSDDAYQLYVSIGQAF